jgi:hypothetical protein
MMMRNATMPIALQKGSSAEVMNILKTEDLINILKDLRDVLEERQS